MQTAHAICANGRDAAKGLLIQTAFMFVFPFLFLLPRAQGRKRKGGHSEIAGPVAGCLLGQAFRPPIGEEEDLLIDSRIISATATLVAPALRILHPLVVGLGVPPLHAAGVA